MDNSFKTKFNSKIKRLFKSQLDVDANQVLRQSKKVKIKSEKNTRNLDKMDKSITQLNKTIEATRYNAKSNLADLNACFDKLHRQ